MTRVLLRRLALHALIALGVSALYGLGALEFLENSLLDVRYRLVQRPATGDIVHVAIDAPSLRELDVWPWPRSFHATLVDRLVDAGAREIVFDVDFSSRSNPSDDARLAAAFERAGDRIVLPVFGQVVDAGTAQEAQIYAGPREIFRRRALVASFSVQPDPDAVVRRMDWAQQWNGVWVPTWAALAVDAAPAAGPPFLIDYGIQTETIERLSYARVLAGDFEPAVIAGKRVIIGATAVELGDFVPVPGGAILPGVLVQMLAVESALQGRTLHRATPLLVILSIVLTQALIGARVTRWSWRKGLIGVAGVGLVLPGGAIAAQAAWPVLIDIVPALTAAVFSYLAGLIGRIDEQQLRILTQSFALRRQNAFIRRVVDNTFDGLLTLDGDGCIQSFNPAAERMFGRARADVQGSALDQLLSDVDECGLPTYLPGFLAALVEMRAPVELTGRRADGRPFAIELAVSHMREDDADIYVAVVRDIDAREQAEAQAKQNRQRLEDAIESVSEAFVLYDSDDRLVLSNARFADIHRHIEVSSGTSFPEICQAFAHVAEGGNDPRWLVDRLARHRSMSGPFEQQLRDGRWFSVSERPTGDGGVVTMMTEITEAKQREHELRSARVESELANRTKSDFIAIMGHELRTPLNAVIGFSEIMKGELFGPINNPTYTGYLADIHGSALRLLEVINDILTISEARSGQPALNEEAVDPAQTVEACMRFVADRARAADVAVTSTVSADHPALRADPRLVKQGLLNLLSNAVKFTQPGGRTTVSTELLPDGGFAISVSDTGIGIAAADIERVTEPFVQADTSLGRKYEGLGLGLTLTKALMLQHGGALVLASEPGRGTTATMRFPAERVHGPAGGVHAEAHVAA